MKIFVAGASAHRPAVDCAAGSSGHSVTGMSARWRHMKTEESWAAVAVVSAFDELA